jgi:hypothetical protein
MAKLDAETDVVYGRKAAKSFGNRVNRKVDLHDNSQNYIGLGARCRATRYRLKDNNNDCLVSVRDK